MRNRLFRRKTPGFQRNPLARTAFWRTQLQPFTQCWLIVVIARRLQFSYNLDGAANLLYGAAG